MDISFSMPFFPDKGFWTDLSNFLELPDAQFQSALARIAADDGFVGRTRLKEHLEAEISNAEQRRALTNFLRNIPEWRASNKQTPTEFVVWFFTFLKDGPFADKDQKAFLEKNEAAFGNRIERIASPIPGIEKQLKAESLARRTGARLLGVELISDLRPVFDPDANELQAIVPITTLRISYRLSETREVAEVHLTEAQLDDLLKKTERAKQKLRVLKDALVRYEIDVPESEMTLTAENL